MIRRNHRQPGDIASARQGRRASPGPNDGSDFGSGHAEQAPQTAPMTDLIQARQAAVALALRWGSGREYRMVPILPA